MLNKNDFISRYPDIRDGMAVYSQDGEKLGKLIYMNDDSFTVEKGIFFPKDFTARYDDIVDVRGDEIIINRVRQDLKDWRDESYAGWNEYDRINVDEVTSRSDQDIRVQAVEERLEAQKTARQAGQVRLRKIVHTELKQLNVPVMHEEVVVERVPVNETMAGAKGTTGATSEFREQTIDVPVMEEQVEVVKRPVVKEEVRVHKEQRVEQQTVSGEVRKEDVRVEGEEALRRRKAG